MYKNLYKRLNIENHIKIYIILYHKNVKICNIDLDVTNKKIVYFNNLNKKLTNIYKFILLEVN